MSERVPPPANDVIMLGKLSEDDFDATVTRAREAVRARFGLGVDGVAPPVTPRPAPVQPTALPSLQTTPTPTAQPTSLPLHPSSAPLSAPPASTVAYMPARVAPAPSVQHTSNGANAVAPHVPVPHAAPVHPFTPPMPSAPPVSATTVLSAAVSPVVAHPHVATAAPVRAPEEIHDTPGDMATRSTGFRISVPMIAIGLLVLAAAGGGVLYFQYAAPPIAASTPPTVAAQGTAHIASTPAGARVTIDGVVRGVTPLTVTLTPGDHTLVLSHGVTTRALPLGVETGTLVKQYVDLGAAAAVTGGRIEVVSDPPNAAVAVDGVASGVTPVLLSDIAPGAHTITIGTGDHAVTRSVEVTAGATASVVVSMTPATGTAGWVTVKSALPLELYEGGKLVAAAGVDRVMLPTGRHELEVVAAEFDFRATVNVNVQAGRTVTASVAVPNGLLSINAVPWAEVLLDGKPIGTTPLANLSVSIGTHEIVWKHPQLGERRQVVKVKAQSPVRAGVDFGK